MTLSKKERFGFRKSRIRSKVFGTEARPRISVARTNTSIYAQIINDEKGFTLVAASNCTPDLRDSLKGKPKIEQAKMIGEYLAKKAVAAGISQVVFDRGGFQYHGRIKALAEAARSGGLKF